MSRGVKSILILSAFPGVFVVAFFVLRHLRATGRDPAFDSDGAILRFLGKFALIIFGFPLLMTFADFLFRRFERWRTLRR